MRYPFVAVQREGLNINEDLFPSELEPIVKLFETDNGGKLKMVKIDADRLFIQGEESELMLRLNGPYFVVARIEFKHKYQGYMGQLEVQLKQLCKEHDEKVGIRIESVLTKEMRQYCGKHGYQVDPTAPNDFILKY